MYDLNGDWVGTINGTNTGDVFVEMRQQDNTVSGKARIQDRVLGVSVYQFTGTIEGDQIVLSLVPENRQQTTTADFVVGGRPVRLEVPTAISSNVNVRATIKGSMIAGKWESALGTGGVFSASKSDRRAEIPGAIVDEKNQIFVMMPIATDKPDLEDILAAVKRAAKKHGLECLRVDEIEHTGKITDLILSEISSSKYLVCDISMDRPNVYYELGYAHGRGKEVILIAREGSIVHFDIRDYSIIFYRSVTELEERLSKRIEAIHGEKEKS